MVSNGNLSNNADWTENTAGAWQVDATAGTVSSTSNDVQSPANFLTPAPSITEQTFTMDFRVTAGTFQPNSGRSIVRLMVNRDVSFNSGVIASFTQFANQTDNFNFNLFENSGNNSSNNKGFGQFSGIGNLGFTLNGAEDGYDNNVSDLLRMTMTNTYSGAENLWSTTAELYNLDTEMTISSGSMDWEADNNYTSDDKLLRFDNQNLGQYTVGGVTSVAISQVSTIPEPSSFGALAGALVLSLVVVRRRR